MKSRSFISFLIFLVCLSVGLIATYQSYQNISPQAVADRIADRLEEDLVHVDAEAAAILKKSSEGSGLDLSSAERCAVFVYNHQQLVQWSDNSFVPLMASVSGDFTVKLLKTGSGAYLAKKWKIDGDAFLVGVIPLHREYKIKNNYLHTEWNDLIFPTSIQSVEEPNSAFGTAVNLNGKPVFKVFFLNNDFLLHDRTRWTAAFFLILSIGVLLIILYDGVSALGRKSTAGGLLLLLTALVLIRFVMIEFNFPNVLVVTQLFDAKNFASSSYNASLGDLILNELVLLAVCYYIFRNYRRFLVLRTAFRNKLTRYIVSILAVLCILFSLLYPFVVIQTLFNNSAIALDITESLQFDSLRVLALIAIVISWICAFLFMHVFMRLSVNKTNRLHTLASVVVGTVIFVGINRYTNQVYLSSLLIGLVYFLLVHFLKLYSSLARFSYLSFVYLFVTLVCFAFNCSYGIHYLEKKKRIENQFRFANNFLIDRDVFGEYLLHETALKIVGDDFIRLRMASPFLSKDIVRQKIRQVFIPSYFNKYDVEIMLFNSAGTPYDNRFGYTFSELIGLYDKVASSTEYKEVRFIDSPSRDITQKYLVKTPVIRFNSIVGYVVVQLSLKKVIPENVYPELLVDNRAQQFYNTQHISYAVFSNKNIIFSSGDYNYEGLFNKEWLGKAKLYKEGIKDGGFIHIAQEDEVGRIAVVSSQFPVFGVSNFSFLLVIGLSVILCLLLAQGVIGYSRGNKLFFSARIQLFLNLAFFVPLIIVSITTLSLTSRSLQEQLNEQYLNKSKTFGGQISQYLDEYLKFTNENQINFENRLTALAKLANVDANVFNPNGILVATSQPLIFENNLLSNYINPLAIAKIKAGENSFIEKEHVGRLEYFVSYGALKSSQRGELIGILAIPFFQSLSSLQKVQIIIFTNILNIFAGIFILLLLLSYLVSEWLTFPLKFITQSLRKTSLLKVNQPLTWQADDEIGLMVKEYNQMLFKLSESKAELEQTQRERAWREIAQQVAHEIKNPLTPMKLVLQQLERASQAGTTSAEKTQKALSSLLIQVETLNEIASSFSTFAKMPEPVIQPVDIVSLLKRIVDLHNQSGEITFRKHDRELIVKGDEQLLGRTFSNIILNAFQAARPGIPIIITIKIQRSTTVCTLIFSDNGKGIDTEHQEQVFVPHFSTKKSGSGLGLAIARQSIEQMGGRIWFETTVGKGTSFYIELKVG